MGYTKDREEFIYIMAKEGVSLWDARSILRHAATRQRLAAETCNRELTDRENGRYDVARVMIASTCQLHHIVPCFSSDPRGATVKLKVPSGKTNDWGQIGVCVPTREY